MELANTIHSDSESTSSAFTSDTTDQFPSTSTGNNNALKPHLGYVNNQESRSKPSAISGPSASLIGISAEPAEAQLSPDATDRVFPMRSFMSVDPTQTPAYQRAEGGDSYFSFKQRYSGGQRVVSNPAQHTIIEEELTNKKHLDAEVGEEVRDIRSKNSPKQSARHSSNFSTLGRQLHSIRDTQENAAGEDHMSLDELSLPSTQNGTELDEGLYTARFRHVITEGGHAVITGRDGQTLQRCEDEPIHIPGAVQGFGMLVALQEEDEGKLIVRIVSENSKHIIGYSPKQLFALESFTDILSEEQTDNLLDHIDFIREEGADVESNGPEVFTISVRNAERRPRKLWCAVHVNDKNPNLIICEFELEDDPINPLSPLHEETPEPPEDTLNSEPTEEEYKDSTETQSRPLRVLRSARKRKGDAAAMEVFNIMSQVQEQLAEAPNLEQFLRVLVGVVKELTGFHRVMIYQFDQMWNGKVVTELVDPRATKDLYKGLHFPASDIPSQARDMYKINKVRLLYDRDQETARLVCRTLEDLDKPLDLTHAYLRAMSPIHIKYLTNMAVRSSMSISINAFGELWGLIACHCYGSKGTRVSFPIRKMCRLVGDSASRNIERLSYASRLQARKLINTTATSRNPSGYIIASSDDLLNLFNADFGFLSIRDETKILGKLEATQECLALLEYLRVRKFTSIMTSQDISFDFPDLRYPPGFQVVAGLLLVPLSAGGNDFIVFFRKGQLTEVKWAGNPYEKFVKEGTEGYLEPRKSFKSWSETIMGRCREWSEEELETAAVLCLVYSKFIEVWWQKEVALQNTQLTKLLLANSAHEVRTPLNAIINYLEIALESSLDPETRENLAKSHSASKSLIYVINDLLDLTKTEAGTELVHEEVFNLQATFREAVDAFQGDAKRKQIILESFEQPDIPEKVLGDQRRVRQAISNVVANAVQATTQGGIKAEISVVSRQDNHVDVEVAVEDTGAGIPSQKLDALFAELEQAEGGLHSMVEDTAAPDTRSLTDGKESKGDKQTLGLGLAIVARIVRNMDGQLRLKSEEGKGSRFVIQFPFDLPSPDCASLVLPDTTKEGTSSPGGLPSDSAVPTSERTVINRAGAVRRNTGGNTPPVLSRKNSGGSFQSFNSIHSCGSFSSAHSARSDVDRMIEAIQEPTMTEKPTPRTRRSIRSGAGKPALSRSSFTSHNGSPAKDKPRNVGSVPENVPEHLRSAKSDIPGQQTLLNSTTPLKAVKMPDEIATSAAPTYEQDPIAATQVDGLLQLSEAQEEQPNADHLHVLVAEDDPINSRIVQKRLEKAGHLTSLTVNGEECASAFGEKAGYFDVILMDMQMPIVDGLSSTKMIRSFEKTYPVQSLSKRAALNGRVPIIAVSASLVEKERQKYMDAGFDGWILKPISFTRLAELMAGIVDQKRRSDNLYKAGNWEQGGWFQQAQSNIFAACTSPTGRIPFSNPTTKLQEEVSNTDPRAIVKSKKEVKTSPPDKKPP